mgnify:CR=1 FL=1
MGLGILWTFCFSSCNIYKQIPEGSSVLTQNQINILGQEKDFINDFFYKDDLYKIPAQKPNKSILGIPVSMHIWAFYNQRKVTKFSQFMKTKVGNPPVIFDSNKIEKSRVAFENYYFNIGHLDNRVEVSYKNKKKKATVEFNIYPNPPYRIRNIIVDTITPIQKDIYTEDYKSYLLEGDIFNINNFNDEINRLTAVAQDKGYYSFNKEFIKFKYDTFRSTHEMDVYVKILEESDSSIFKKYKVDSVFVLLNTNSEKITTKEDKEITQFNNVQFVQTTPKNYNEKFLSNFIYQYHDSFYSKSDINYTIQRLNELNNFKLINSTINLKSADKRVLDLYYSLTPFPRRNITFGQYVYNSTLGFIGAQPTVTFTNRNLTKNADKLNLSLSGAIEFNAYLNQNKNYSGLISRTDISLQANYNLEKFLLPIIFSNKTKYLYNRTTFNGQYTYSRRLGYYDIHNIGLTAGYEWTKKRNNSFSFAPLMFNAIIFPESSVTDKFKETLAQNPFLRASFNNAFILGSSFQMTHYTQFGRKKLNVLNYKINLEMAGNSAFLIDKISPLSRNSETININGIDVSQYIKAQFEVSSSHKINKITSFHTRAKMGLAFPFGNSSRLPYIKHFYIGGPYSLRAFQPRTIGPGIYNPSIYDTGTYKLPKDQLGNMVFEANAEYRFNIISFIKGALFVDAGNIWNSSIDYSNSELSVFKLSDFYKQLYIGGGMGIRADFTYFIMRFDLGVPIRIPYLTSNDWVIKDAKPLNSDWRGNNLVINIAVGYPF